MKLSKISLLCATALAAVSLPLCASSMSINVSSNLDNTSGNVEVDGVYIGHNSAYDINVYGVHGESAILNSFVKSGGSVNTATQLDFTSPSGRINAQERIGATGVSDNGSGGEFITGAVGLGVKDSSMAKISSEGTSSNDPRVTYNINKAQGVGNFAVGVDAHSFKYSDTVSPSCPYNSTATKIVGSDEYYTYKQKAIGAYNYTGKFNIGK